MAVDMEVFCNTPSPVADQAAKVDVFHCGCPTPQLLTCTSNTLSRHDEEFIAVEVGAAPHAPPAVHAQSVQDFSEGDLVAEEAEKDPSLKQQCEELLQDSGSAEEPEKAEQAPEESAVAALEDPPSMDEQETAQHAPEEWIATAPDADTSEEAQTETVEQEMEECTATVLDSLDIADTAISIVPDMEDDRSSVHSEAVLCLHEDDFDCEKRNHALPVRIRGHLQGNTVASDSTSMSAQDSDSLTKGVVPRQVSVYLPGGKEVTVEDPKLVAAVRWEVAEAVGVSPTQVQIIAGVTPLPGMACLSKDDLADGLAAVVLQYPVEAATIAQGAGALRVRHLSAGKCQKICSATQAVKLPRHVDKNEWIAAHLCQIYEEVAYFPAAFSDICTCETCPRMVAGEYAYRWREDPESRRPEEKAAPDYMRLVVLKLHAFLFDSSMFPRDASPLFPEDFRARVTKLLKVVFAVYAHLFCSHYQEAAEKRMAEDLDFCFRHFVFFVLEFELLAEEDMTPLIPLVRRLQEQMF